MKFINVGLLFALRMFLKIIIVNKWLFSFVFVFKQYNCQKITINAWYAVIVTFPQNFN